MFQVEIRKVREGQYAAYLVRDEKHQLVCLTANLSQARREAASVAKAHSIPCVNLVPEVTLTEMFQRKSLWEFNKVAGL